MYEISNPTFHQTESDTTQVDLLREEKKKDESLEENAIVNWVQPHCDQRPESILEPTTAWASVLSHIGEV